MDRVVALTKTLCFIVGIGIPRAVDRVVALTKTLCFIVGIGTPRAVDRVDRGGSAVAEIRSTLEIYYFC